MTRKAAVKPKIENLPADPVGQRYCQRFHFPYHAIIAPTPKLDEDTDWRTVHYYLEPSKLWDLHQDPLQIVGTRFGSTTLNAWIDLDTGGDHHSQSDYAAIKSALERIGIVRVVPTQSSLSGGYHLILPFTEAVPTYGLACALEQTLRDAGLPLRQGHIEIFPNPKPFCQEHATDYNGIRCPLQIGCGSFLLDEDLEPLSNDVSIFLEHCDLAAAQQDLTQLKREIAKARKRLQAREI